MRSATTGSFLDALLDGISPEISVKPMLIRIKMIAALKGRIALKLLKPVSAFSIKLIGIHNR